MTRTLACMLVLGAVAATAMFAPPAVAADKIAVLIIDGQNNHNWKATTPPIKDMLEKTGKFTVDVLTSPPKLDPKKNPSDEEKKAVADGWAKFRPDFSKYQVVFSNYNGESWPAEVNAAFEKYMTNGGGLVVFHAANNAFEKWDEWNKMVGLAWQGPGFGDRITVDDAGNVVRTPKGEGPGAGHGPQHPYLVLLRDQKHAITRGIPE
ncbi:MAG: ThuA domain-containing protein, partial [Planctomycetota bacterium]|nr:ThuA domain-containing protein [Planctomycetota bacterium]